MNEALQKFIDNKLPGWRANPILTRIASHIDMGWHAALAAKLPCGHPVGCLVREELYSLSMHREFCGWCADKAKRDAELAAANINLSSVMKRQQKLEAERDALRKSVASFEKEEDRLEGMIMDLQDKRAKCSAERDALMMMAERYFIALVQVSEKPCVEVTTKDLRKIAEAALKEKP